MDFKLSYRLYIQVKYFIWISYLFYFIYLLDEILDNAIIYSVLLCAVLIQLTVISFINNWYKYDRPSLIDWFRLTTFIVLVLNFLFFIKDIKHQENFEGYIVKQEYILPSLLVILVGLIGLKSSEILFVYFKKRIEKRKTYIRKYQFRNAYLFIAMSVIVAFIQLYLQLKGEVGYGTFQENTTSENSFLFQILFILSALFLSLFSIFKFLYEYKNRLFNLFFIIFFIIQLIFGLLSGMKEEIIVPIIIVLVPYLLSGRKLSTKLVYLGIIAILFIYPLNDNYREILNSFQNIEKDKAFSIALINTMRLDITDNLEQGRDSYTNRLSLFPYLVYAVENEQEWVYFKNLDRFIYLPVAWIIPRKFIPDKPISETGSVLNNKIYGYDTNSVTVTTYGWSYLEGGYFYVFILFTIFGLFISYFQFGLGFENLFGLLIYTGILVALLKVETDIYFLMNEILQKTLIYYLLYKLLIKEIIIPKTDFIN